MLGGLVPKYRNTHRQTAEQLERQHHQRLRMVCETTMVQPRAREALQRACLVRSDGARAIDRHRTQAEDPTRGIPCKQRPHRLQHGLSDPTTARRRQLAARHGEGPSRGWIHRHPSLPQKRSHLSHDLQVRLRLLHRAQLHQAQERRQRGELPTPLKERRKGQACRATSVDGLGKTSETHEVRPDFFSSNVTYFLVPISSRK